MPKNKEYTWKESIMSKDKGKTYIFNFEHVTTAERFNKKVEVPLGAMDIEATYIRGMLIGVPKYYRMVSVSGFKKDDDLKDIIIKSWNNEVDEIIESCGPDDNVEDTVNYWMSKSKRRV